MNNVGRPRQVLDRDAIDQYRRSGLTWTDISRLLEISIRSLQRWREDNNYEVQSLKYLLLNKTETDRFLLYYCRR